MTKYKVNLKFKDTSISLDEIIIDTLKIELTNIFNINYNYLEEELDYKHTNYKKIEGSIN